MKTLSREAIQRMITDRIGSGSGGSSSGGGSGQSGNFVSIDYWNTIFVVHGKQKVTVTDGTLGTQTVTITDVELPPNATPSTTTTEDETTGDVTVTEITIESVEVKYNFWSDGGVSALGQNSGGGGGGGTTLNEPLASINSAGLADHPSTSGQAIIWNGSAWTYGTAGGGSGTSLNALLANINNSSIGNIAPTSSEIGKCLVYNGSGVWAWATPGGGGGSLYALLNSINTSTIGNVAPGSSNDGKCLVWDNTNSTWAWATPGGGGGGLTYGLSWTYGSVSSATGGSYDGSASGSFVIPKDTADLTNGAGFITSSAISDMATKTWVNSQGFLTSISFSNLPTLYWGNLPVSNVSNLATEPQFGHVRLRSGFTNYGSYLRFGDGYYCYLNEDTDDHLTIYASKGVEITTGSGYDLTWNGDAVATQSWVSQQGFLTSETYRGTVTSVGMTVPTGFSISGSPVTSSGTLALSFASGYSLPTTAKQSTWDAKQDAISDLSTIRSNASHGESAYNDLSKYLLKEQGMRFLSQGAYIAARFVTETGANDSTRSAVAQGDGYIEWWSSGGYFNHEMGFIRAKGNVTIGTSNTDTTHYLQIGGGRIYWDNTNKGLYVQHADGTAANIFATGGVSSLGIGISGSASLNTLTAGTMNVNTRLNCNGVAHFDDDIIINVGGSDYVLDTARCIELGILS